MDRLTFTGQLLRLGGHQGQGCTKRTLLGAGLVIPVDMQCADGQVPRRPSAQKPRRRKLASRARLADDVILVGPHISLRCGSMYSQLAMQL
jgi:hypothetical protein